MDYLDNSIYQIKGYEDKYGIGFFCSLKCHDKNLFVLITNYQIINDNYLKNYNYIDVLINQKLIRIGFNLIYYLDKHLDLSVVEIKENKAIKILELDEDIYMEESEIYLNKESIYIINDNSVSYSIINNITKYEFIFNCNLNNKIEILINIDDKDINNKIYFLDNEYIENNIKRLTHDNLLII